MYEHSGRDERTGSGRLPGESPHRGRDRPVERQLRSLQSTAGNAAVHELVGGGGRRTAAVLGVQRAWDRSYGHPGGELPPKTITPAMVVAQVKSKKPYYALGATQKDARKRTDRARGWIYTFYAYYRAVFSNGNERWGIVLVAHTHVKHDGSKVAGNMYIPGHADWDQATDPALVAQVPAYDATTHKDGWSFGDFGGDTHRYPTYWVVKPVDEPAEKAPEKVVEGAGL